MSKKNDELFPNTKTVYGPVPSRRFGDSVGVDPIFEISTCTFNCIYCQLGSIQKQTTERKVFVPTEKIVADLKELMTKGDHFDVLTFSGSGEPTLALNLKEISYELKKVVRQQELLLLTNGSLLHRQDVRDDLEHFDRVIVKLDALENDQLKRINRPHPEVSFEKIVEGIKALRPQYKGKLELQTMVFRAPTEQELEELAKLYRELKPDAIQINTPTRPYPLSWHRENRGNHLGIFDYEVKKLLHVSKEEARLIEQRLSELTGVKLISVYKES